MQKKVLLSFLATIPVAITASAHENVAFENLLKINPGSDYWTYNGITNSVEGSDEATIEDGAAVGSVSLNVIEAYKKVFNNENLPAGTYKVQFLTLQNAVVNVNGRELTDGTFDYNGNGEFNIEIKSNGVASVFTFGKGSLELICDFGLISNELAKKNDSITIDALTEQSPASATYTALKNRGEQLEARKAEIATKIANIGAEDQDADYYIKQYIDYALGQTPNTVDGLLSELKEDVDAYNEDVARENQRYSIQQTNESNYNILKDSYDGFKEQVSQFEKELVEGTYPARECAEGLAALKERMSAYENLLNGYFKNGEAFKDDEVVEKSVIDYLNNDFQPLEVAFNALKKTYETAKADQQAYDTWYADYQKLIAAQKEATDGFAATAEGNAVYDDMRDGYTEKVNAIVQNAIDDCTIKLTGTYEGAAENLDADKQIIADAIAAVSAQVDQFNNIVTTQDRYKAADDELISRVEEKFATVDFSNVIDETKKEEFVAEKAKIQEVIETMKSTVDSLYGEHKLTGSDITDLADNALNNIEELNNNIADQLKSEQKQHAVAESNAAFIEKVTATYEALKNHINNDLFPADHQLAGKFEPTLQNLEKNIEEFKAYINGLTANGEFADGQFENAGYEDLDATDWQSNLLTNISDIRNISDAIKTDYDAIKTAQAQMQDVLNSFQALYDNKQVVKDKDGNPLVEKAEILGDTITTLQANIDAIDTNLNSIDNSNNQVFKDEMEALANTVAGQVEQFNADVAAAELAFAKGVTEANARVANEARQKTGKILSELEKLTPVPAGFTEWESAVNQLTNDNYNYTIALQDLVANTDAKPSEFNPFDPTAQEIYDKAVELLAQGKKIKANHEAKVALDIITGGISSDINNVREWLNNNTNQPAKTHYLDQLAGYESQFNEIIGNIDTDYNAIGLTPKQQDYKDQLSALKVKIDKVQTDAQGNEANHNAQLSQIDELNNRYDFVKDFINTTDEITSDKEERLAELEEQKTRIEELQQTIFDAYSEGKSQDENKSINATYEDILEKINNIYQSLVDEYTDKVIDYNDNKVADSNWNAIYTELDQVYNKAVATYDLYHNSLLNQGYKEFVGNAIDNHNTIIDFIGAIRDLKTTFNNKVNFLTDKTNNENAPELITEENINEWGIIPAQNLIDQIKAEVRAMKDEANSLAEEYYTQERNEKVDILTNAMNVLRDAGISEDIIENDFFAPYKNKLGDAESLYNAAKTLGDLSPWMGAKITDDGKVAVGGIADILDGINVTNLDYEHPATIQWNRDFDAAQETLNGYKTTVDGYKMLTSEDGFDARFDDIQSQLDNLNNEAKSAQGEKAMFSNLPDFEQMLRNIMSKAEEVYNDATALENGRVAEKAAYDKFIADLGTSTDSLDALKAWVGGMAIEPEAQPGIDAIQRAIDDLDKTINDNSGKLTDSEIAGQIQDALDSINEQIEAAYQADYTAEKAELNKLLIDAQLSLNEYKLDNNLPSEDGNVSRIYNILNGCDESLNALGDDLAKADRETTGKTLIDIQKQLCEVIAELAEKRGIENPATTVFTNLNAQYAEIYNDLENIFDGVDESVKDQFANDVDNLKDKLSALGDAIQDEGSGIIATGDSYKNELIALGNDVDALKDKIDQAQADFETEQANQAASDAAAANLQNQINDYQAKLNAFKTFIDETEISKDSELNEAIVGSIENMQSRIDAMQTWLDEQKAAYALNADTSLPDADELNESINILDAFVWMESTIQIRRAQNAINVTDIIIAGQKHNNQAELEAKLDALQGRVVKFKESASIEDVKALTQEVDAIIADAQALTDEAIANAYIVGDLDGDGEVTMTDLQNLLDIIAEYDDETSDKNSGAFKAADVDQDGTLDIGDAITLANKLLGGGVDQIRQRLAAAAVSNAMVRIQAIDGDTANGIRAIEIHLTNSVDFVGGQFDLKLPAGMQILSEKLSERTEGMMMATSDLDSNHHRVVVLSENMRNMKGSEGVVLELEVVGNGNIYVENSIFGDSAGNKYYGTDPGTTGLDGLINSAKDGAQKIYDTAGRMMNKLQKGINIIVNGKGKGEKVIRRK